MIVSLQCPPSGAGGMVWASGSARRRGGLALCLVAFLGLFRSRVRRGTLSRKATCRSAKATRGADVSAVAWGRAWRSALYRSVDNGRYYTRPRDDDGLADLTAPLPRFGLIKSSR